MNIDKEREELRAQQSAAVMPLIGPLLDAWEHASHDDRHAMNDCGVGAHLKAIYRAMTADCAALDEQKADMVSCGCGDLYPADSYGAGFIDAKGHCANCEAAESCGDEQKARPSNEEWLQRLGILLGEYGEAVSFDDPADVERAANAVYDFARALLSKYAAPAPEGEPCGYPCKIIEADFDTGTVLLQMDGRFTASAGPKFLCDAAPVNEQDSKDAQALIEAAKQVLNWTEVAHRPPVREAFPCGATARVRVLALADLHDAVAAIAQQGKGE